jgi:glycerol-3-phosphate dehydrogenase
VLETAAFFSQKTTRADLLTVFAGLRPLAAQKRRKKAPKRFLEVANVVSDTGLITLLVENGLLIEKLLRILLIK